MIIETTSSRRCVIVLHCSAPCGSAESPHVQDGRSARPPAGAGRAVDCRARREEHEEEAEETQSNKRMLACGSVGGHTAGREGQSSGVMML